MNPVRIFLVDDHAILLDGLVAAFAMFPRVKVVGTAQSGEEALVAIQAQRANIDVVVTDHSMSGMDGVTLCETLKKGGDLPRVVLLTMHSVPEVAFKAVRKGVDRIILKSTSIDKVVDNIISVLENPDEAVVPTNTPDHPSIENLGLTKTEMMVLRMIAYDELTTREIAEKLFRSTHTIERHRKSIMLKLGVHNTAGLVNYAHSIKLVD